MYKDSKSDRKHFLTGHTNTRSYVQYHTKFLQLKILKLPFNAWCMKRTFIKDNNTAQMLLE